MNLLTEFRHTKIQIMHKTPCKAIFVNDLKCYSDWKFGAIEIDLTTLTLRITEDSAKQLVNSLQLTENSGIGLLGEGNVSYVLPAHSEILLSLMS